MADIPEAMSIDGEKTSEFQDITPRTIVPPMTNGGIVRSMDNRQLGTV